MNISWVHIQRWPRELTKHRKSSPFDSTLGKTLSLLEKELDAIRVTSAVIQVAMPEGSTFAKTGRFYARSELRLDGQPYSTSTGLPLHHPGIILAFEKKKQPMSFPCDAFGSWEANLRGIALALEALRKIDRYGVTSNAEQYRGWYQLPPPGGAIAMPARMSLEDAAKIVSPSNPSLVIKEKSAMQDWYRQRAKNLHPDAGGDAIAWSELQRAAELLKAHHGIA